MRHNRRVSARNRSGSVAQQIFLLQTLVVVLLVVGAVSLAVVDARRSQLDSARLRSVDVARAVADSPTVVRALRTARPSTVIQPFAERVRVDTGTDFVVVMGLDRTRYSHPDPARIGQQFIGDLGRPHRVACSPRSTPARSGRRCAPSSPCTTGTGWSPWSRSASR